MDTLEKKITESAYSFAMSRMKHVHSSHGWDHVKRVIAMADHISGTQKDSDNFIVHVSAILHDIERDEESRTGGKVCHAEMGSKSAYNFLVSEGLDEKRSGHIARCILTHRYRNSHKPDSLEAKILFDADKLDSIGAVGIGRAFLFSGEIGAKLHDPGIVLENTRSYTEEDTAYREYLEKLRFVHRAMLTSEGERMARERNSFMEVFFARMNDEVRGIR